MPERYGPRFGLEASFLVLLAVGAGLADLRPAVIVLVMAAGWLLVALIELVAWRASRPQPPPLSEPEPVLHGWDVAEIIAPRAEEPEHVEAELTRALPAESVQEERPRRRWLRRRRREG